MPETQPVVWFWFLMFSLCVTTAGGGIIYQIGYYQRHLARTRFGASVVRFFGALLIAMFLGWSMATQDYKPLIGALAVSFGAYGSHRFLISTENKK